MKECGLRSLPGLASFLLLFFLPTQVVVSGETIVWTNTAGGNWSSSANWNPNSVPGTSDTALITNIGNYTVSITAPVTIAALTLGGSGGNIVLNNGSLLNVTDLLVWRRGILQGAGTTRVAPAGALSLVDSAKSLIQQVFVNEGNAQWSQGSVALTSGASFTNAVDALLDFTADGTAFSGVTEGAFVNLGILRKSGGSGTNTVGVAFRNGGSVEVQSGTLDLSGDGPSSGLFNISSNATLSFSAVGTMDIENTSSISGNGNLRVARGTVNLSGALLHRGTNIVVGGTAAFLTGQSLTNDLVVTGGTALFDGAPVFPGRLNLSGGFLRGSNAVAVTGPFHWTGGTISTGALVIAEGPVTLTGSAAKTVAGGILVVKSGASWQQGQFRLDHGAVCTNSAGSTFAFGGVLASTGSSNAFYNLGTMQKNSIGSGIIASALHNAGSLHLLDGSLQLSGGGAHSGSLETAAGTSLYLSGTHLFDSSSTIVHGTGEFEVAAGGNVTFNGSLNYKGPVVFSGGFSTINGPCVLTNSLSIATANVTFNSSAPLIEPSSLVLTGSLLGSNAVTVRGPMIWNGGSVAGSGLLTVQGDLTIGGTAKKTLDGRRMVAHGANQWLASQGNWEFRSGALFSNAPGATMDILADRVITNSAGGGAIINAGLWRNLGTGDAIIRVPMTNSGTVEIKSGQLNFSAGAGAYYQTAGLTLLNGGGMKLWDLDALPQFRAPNHILGGTIAGNGLIDGTLTNSGVCSPGLSSGQLTIAGNYWQTANGSLQVELAGPPQSGAFDSLVVNQTAFLGGGLNVSFANGYVPSPDTTFSIVQAGSRVGTFVDFNYPENLALLQLHYTATNVGISTGTLPVTVTPMGYTDGEFRFLIHGSAGTDYTIFASTNLTDWTILESITATNMPVHFADPAATLFSRRFYRIQMEQ